MLETAQFAGLVGIGLVPASFCAWYLVWDVLQDRRVHGKFAWDIQEMESVEELQVWLESGRL